MYEISIITINFNNIGGLIKTIESVLFQSYNCFEYIVIDGASTDESAEYIIKNANKFNYFVSEPDQGIYNAMNKGIRASTGKYLLFLNSGDYFFDKNVLKNAVNHLGNYDLVYFDLFFSRNNKLALKSYPEKLSFCELSSNSLPHPATFIKKTLFDLNGHYDESFKVVSDWKFFIEVICLHNCTYKKVAQALSVFNTDGTSSIPQNRSLIYNEMQTVLINKFSAFIGDLEEFKILRNTIAALRKSRKIQLLIKLNQLNPF